MLELIFNYIGNSNDPFDRKQAASIILKNYIEHFWVTTIKINIV
jgi:hypothetical protein